MEDSKIVSITIKLTEEDYNPIHIIREDKSEESLGGGNIYCALIFILSEIINNKGDRRWSGSDFCRLERKDMFFIADKMKVAYDEVCNMVDYFLNEFYDKAK